MKTEITVTPYASALGAEIGGVDLAQPLEDEAFALIHGAFLEHHLIFFRDQTLTPQQQLAFAWRLGPPDDYPFADGLPECPQVVRVTKEAHETRNFGGEWHSDTTYLEAPPLATVLYAREIPSASGDTLYANMYLAYEQLSDGMKALIGGLTAINTAGLLNRTFGTIPPKNLDEQTATSAEHPVVRTHPGNGAQGALHQRGAIPATSRT